ncbi:MAG: hypothetical protein ACRD99_01915 [Nitrososphaera sp.]
MNSKTKTLLLAALAATVAAGIIANAQQFAAAGSQMTAQFSETNNGYTDEYLLEDCDFATATELDFKITIYKVLAECDDCSILL